MVPIIEGIVFFILGSAVLTYNFRSWNRGTIRIGHAPKGTIHLDSEYVVNRYDRPVLFMIGVIVYGIIGFGSIFFSVLLLTGITEPLTSGVTSLMKSK